MSQKSVIFTTCPRKMIFNIFWSMKESQEIEKYKKIHLMFIKICKKNLLKIEKTVCLQNFKANFQIFNGG
jgi:hypothetical protein